MKVDTKEINPAYQSIIQNPSQTVFLDANFFIPPDRSKIKNIKPYTFEHFKEIWLVPLLSEFAGLSVHESVYKELVVEKVKIYADEQLNCNPRKLKVYHDSELNSKEMALLNYYIAKIAVHSQYDPHRDNTKDRGEVKSLSFMAVKQYLYFAANDALPVRLIKDADKLGTGLDNMGIDMEVKQSEKEDNSLDIGASLSGNMNLGIIKVNISGNVSVHNSNTRSSDNSAKYHVDVRATNHGTPEGLARVLDMMAANVAPALVGSTIKDGNGNDLPEKARIKAERLKALRQEISQIEKRLRAAQDGLHNSIQQMKRIASDQQSVYQSAMNRLLDGTSKDKQDETALQYGNVMNEVSESWTIFQNRLPDTISQITATKGSDINAAKSDKLSEMFALKALKQEGNAPSSTIYGAGEAYYASLVGAQNNAVTSQMTVNQIEMELFDKRAEYTDAVSGKTTTSSLKDNRIPVSTGTASSANTAGEGKKPAKTS